MCAAHEEWGSRFQRQFRPLSPLLLPRRGGAGGPTPSCALHPPMANGHAACGPAAEAGASSMDASAGGAADHSRENGGNGAAAAAAAGSDSEADDVPIGGPLTVRQLQCAIAKLMPGGCSIKHAVRRVLRTSYVQTAANTNSNITHIIVLEEADCSNAGWVSQPGPLHGAYFAKAASCCVLSIVRHAVQAAHRRKCYTVLSS